MFCETSLYAVCAIKQGYQEGKKSKTGGTSEVLAALG